MSTTVEPERRAVWTMPDESVRIRFGFMDAGKSVQVFDLAGTLIIEHPWPKPGTTYVSNRRPRGRSTGNTRRSEMS